MQMKRWKANKLFHSFVSWGYCRLNYLGQICMLVWLKSSEYVYRLACFSDKTRTLRMFYLDCFGCHRYQFDSLFVQCSKKAQREQPETTTKGGRNREHIWKLNWRWTNSTRFVQQLFSCVVCFSLPSPLQFSCWWNFPMADAYLSLSVNIQHELILSLRWKIAKKNNEIGQCIE